MIYVIVILGIILAFGGWTLHEQQVAVDNYKAKVDEQQKKLDAQAKDLLQEAANHEIDMGAAYEAGQAKAKVVYRNVYQTAQQNVATHTEFVTAPCVMDADSLHLLNSARASLRLSTTALQANGGMSSPVGPAAGREVHDPVPPAVSGPPSDQGVQGQPQSTGDSNQGSGSNLRAHPKPVPVGRQ